MFVAALRPSSTLMRAASGIARGAWDPGGSVGRPQSVRAGLVVSAVLALLGVGLVLSAESARAESTRCHATADAFVSHAPNPGVDEEDVFSHVGASSCGAYVNIESGPEGGSAEAKSAVEAGYGLLTGKFYSDGTTPTLLVSDVGRGTAQAMGEFTDRLTITKPGGGEVELRLRLTLESATTFLDRPVCPPSGGIRAWLDTERGPTGIVRLEQRCNDGLQVQQAELRLSVTVPSQGPSPTIALKGHLDAHTAGEATPEFRHVSATVDGPVSDACRVAPNLEPHAARAIINVDVMTGGGDYVATSGADYRTDTGAPVTASTVSPSPNGSGWHRDATSVRLTASDPSEVSRITYSATGANPIPRTSSDGASADVPITAEGETTLEFSAIDCHGNEEAPQHVNVRIDKSDPVVTAQARFSDGTPYTGGWTNRKVTVYFTCADEHSGIADACPSPIVVDQDSASAAGTTVSSGPVRDRAGNIGTGSTVVKLDRSGPTVTQLVAWRSPAAYGFPSGGTYESGTWSYTAVHIHWECVDIGKSGAQENTGFAYFADFDSAGNPLPRESRYTPKCKDVAGNVGASDEWIVRVDTRRAHQYPMVFAHAMTADPSLVVGAAYVTSGVEAAERGATAGVVGSGILGGLWSDFPTNGSAAAALSTGPVYNPLEGSGDGDEMSPPGQTPERGEFAFDVTTIRIDVWVPEGATCLGFDSQFVGAPQWDDDNGQWDSEGRDVFVAELDNSTWTTDELSPGYLNAPDSFGVDGRSQISVTPGAHSLYLSIADLEDALGNSVVLLDNLQANTDC